MFKMPPTSRRPDPDTALRVAPKGAFRVRISGARFGGGWIGRRAAHGLGWRHARGQGICPKARWTSLPAGAKIGAGRMGESPMTTMTGRNTKGAA